MKFTNTSHQKRYVKLITFLFILCIVAIPRLVDLEHPSFTYDELADYGRSIKFCKSGTITKPISGGYQNGQLPFFISCLFYKIFGQQEKTARLLSVLASLLTILGVFLIANRLWGYWWAIMAATMFGLSPFYLSCSRLASSHGHIFSSFLVTLSLYYFLKVLDDRTSCKDSRSAPHLCNAADSKRDNIVDVSKQLGHHDPGFTLKRYAHWMPGEHKSQVDELGKLATKRTLYAP